MGPRLRNYAAPPQASKLAAGVERVGPNALFGRRSMSYRRFGERISQKLASDRERHLPDAVNLRQMGVLGGVGAAGSEDRRDESLGGGSLQDRAEVRHPGRIVVFGNRHVRFASLHQPGLTA